MGPEREFQFFLLGLFIVCSFIGGILTFLPLFPRWVRAVGILLLVAASLILASLWQEIMTPQPHLLNGGMR